MCYLVMYSSHVVGYAVCMLFVYCLYYRKEINHNCVEITNLQEYLMDEFVTR